MILAIIIVFLITISYIIDGGLLDVSGELYKIITKNILKLFQNYEKRRSNL